MEMDQEDGTELVLSFAVDVNENRAEGYKTHTLQPLAQTQGSHRNSVFQSGPKSSVHSGGTRATSEGTEINGFPEPDGGVELSLEPKDGESKPDTSGHLGTPDGETGRFGEINPNLTQNRNLDCSDVHLKASGLINSANGEEVDLFGFHASSIAGEGTAGIGGTNSTLITSGETSDTRGNHSSWFISSEKASVHGNDGPLTASGYTNALDGRAADVWGFRASTFVIGESSGNRTTSAETSGDRGTNISWDITGEVASVGETNGNLTASRPGTTSDVDDAHIWEFHSSPIVLGETVSTRETSGNRTTSGEITGWTHVSPVALETSGIRGSNAVSRETVSVRGPNGGTNLAVFGETDVTRCAQVSSVVTKEASQAHETDTSPSVADEMVDIGGTSASLFTSGETACTRKTNPGPVAAGIGGSLTTCGNVSTLEVKTAATLSGDPMSLRETGVSQVEAGPIDMLPLVDEVSPRDQVSGNLHLGNNATKAKFAIWENPDRQVRPRVCVGKCLSSCCMELEMKIPNGDMNCDKLQMDKIRSAGTFTNEALDKGVRVGNCGYLVINRRTISGTSSIPVYSIREPWSATEQHQELRSTSDLGPETISNISNLSIANVNEVSNQEIETRPAYDVDFSDGVGVARPRTLRTNLGPGQAVSLSCDSTPLNDDNAGYFVDDGDMDVIMNNLELGRRQSAPDKLQKSEYIDPEPSAEQTVNKRHGFTDFLTRYERKAQQLYQQSKIMQRICKYRNF